MYERSIKKTLLITETQDRRVKNFCSYNRISFSQLIRLFIDELRITEFDSLRTSLEQAGFKTQDFVGAFDKERPVNKITNLENGRKVSQWQKKSSWFNNIF